MPLTSKGRKIMSAMKENYGEEKGEGVFYASKNAGKIKGVDAAKFRDALRSGRSFRDAFADALPSSGGGNAQARREAKGGDFFTQMRDSARRGLSARDCIRDALAVRDRAVTKDALTLLRDKWSGKRR
jgi:hypothetical protein